MFGLRNLDDILPRRVVRRSVNLKRTVAIWRFVAWIMFLLLLISVSVNITFISTLGAVRP
jgi:hypothetical protein